MRNFLTYNNGVPIIISLLMLGGGSAFAATDPGAIVSSSQQVTAVDNTYITSADLTNWDFKLKIDSVTEDTDNYYVAYEYQTIQIVSAAWQPVILKKSMTVSKKEIEGQDLGVFVSKQLSQLTTQELAYLTQVQANERTKGVTQEVVATTYSGLVGKFLNPEEETFAGYTPVVVPPPPPQVATVINSGIPAPDTPGGSAGTDEQNTNGSSGSANTGGSSSTLLQLQVLGDNPSIIGLHSSYADLGAVLLDPGNPNLGYYSYVDGTQELPPVIDTSSAGAHTVEYRATDQAGVLVVARRIVLVGGAQDPGGEINSAGSVSFSNDTTPAPQPQTPSVQPAPSDSSSGTETLTPPSTTPTTTITVPETTQSTSTTDTDTPTEVSTSTDSTSTTPTP